MIKYWTLLLCLFSCNGRPIEDLACGAKFSDSVTSYKDGRKTFVILEVFRNGKNEKICLTNVSLYFLLHRKFRVEGNAYVDLVRRLLNKTKLLELTNNEINDDQIVVPDVKIKNLYTAGLDTLIDTYFVNGVQNDRAIENKNYLVSILFENCIISWIDDESGFIVISNENGQR